MTSFRQGGYRFGYLDGWSCRAGRAASRRRAAGRLHESNRSHRQRTHGRGGSGSRRLAVPHPYFLQELSRDLRGSSRSCEIVSRAPSSQVGCHFHVWTRLSELVVSPVGTVESQDFVHPLSTVGPQDPTALSTAVKDVVGGMSWVDSRLE